MYNISILFSGNIPLTYCLYVFSFYYMWGLALTVELVYIGDLPYCFCWCALTGVIRFLFIFLNVYITCRFLFFCPVWYMLGMSIYSEASKLETYYTVSVGVL